MRIEGVSFQPVAPAAPRDSRVPSTVDLSAASKMFDAVDRVFDLSRAGRNVLDAYNRLSVEEQQGFLQAVATLLRHNVIGTETVDLAGRPHTTHVDARAADPALSGAAPYRHRLDVRG